MNKFWWLLSVLMILVLSMSVIVACGDDDDDDDDDDSTGDDDDDSDSTSGPYSDCVAYYMACFEFTEDMSLEVCQELLELETSCSTGAMDRLFECTGTDCGKWDECSTIWEEEINC